MKKTTTVIIIILALALIILTAFWLSNRTETKAPVVPAVSVVEEAITISEQSINEENFTGSRPVISGSAVIVAAANSYLDVEIADFKTIADTEVPERRKEFGEDTPPSHYGLDFTAAVVEGQETQSIVLDGYRYMGGANGMSYYKVFTMKKGATTILSLDDVVNNDKKATFTEYVKNNIIKEQEGIFTESVNTLTFESFKNFAFTPDALIIYFDKYEIGAGALGAIGFSLPLAEIGEFLVL